MTIIFILTLFLLYFLFVMNTFKRFTFCLHSWSIRYIILLIVYGTLLYVLAYGPGLGLDGISLYFVLFPALLFLFVHVNFIFSLLFYGEVNKFKFNQLFIYLPVLVIFILIINIRYADCSPLFVDFECFKGTGISQSEKTKAVNLAWEFWNNLHANPDLCWKIHFEYKIDWCHPESFKNLNQIQDYSTYTSVGRILILNTEVLDILSKYDISCWDFYEESLKEYYKTYPWKSEIMNKARAKFI